ncbi:hypothetical protein CBP17_16070 [Fischerella thermalis WC114]|nr:hypothetical protein CBP18_17715 [Fischerella thermalis WC119]PLZ08133.1 hypothetical protein CBP17_16070 [Fischerella thermalis WC114]PLZ08960.1 hypothetical protein CBP19_16325 [Fischerella thermalis WC1110]PLZ41387.1 hypothetical protein CBP25_16835 [Fischerella thermalis WC527]
MRIYSQTGYGVSARCQITNYQLPITNYPLPITHYPLPIIYILHQLFIRQGINSLANSKSQINLTRMVFQSVETDLCY